MFRKIFAVLTAAALTLCMAGCSEYVMTEDDLAVYESVQGYWAADIGTGYNEFDEDGNLTAMIVVEFTDDFNYIMHICYLDQGYALSYPPVKYSFEDKLFKVMTDGVASYAQLSASDDGQTLYWHTNDKTDTYLRISKDEAASLGIPEYSAESWVTDESGNFINETNMEAPAADNSDTEAPNGESDTDTEDNAAAQAEVNSYGRRRSYSGTAE